MIWYFPRWVMAASVGVALMVAAWGVWWRPEPPRQKQAAEYSYEGGDIPPLIERVHPTPEERIATYNFWLVIVGAFTTFAIFRQVTWMERTDRRIGEQIDLARSEFLATHRPAFRIRHITFTWTGPPTAPAGHGRVTAILTNHGGSDATIVDSRLFGNSRPAGTAVPGGPPYYGVTHLLEAGTVIAAGKSYDIERTEANLMVFFFTPPDNDTGKPGAGREWFYRGYVVFADAFGRQYRFGFCRRWNSDTGRFTDVVNDPDYEYSD